MSTHLLTSDQVAALAPDAASARAGQGLATPRKWVSLGSDGRAFWGECQGSGAKPYQVIVDLREPAFRCSCPSRKFPCKHALGVLFLLAAQPGAAPESAPPPWVEEWLAAREARAGKRAEKAAGAPAPPASAAPDEAAREARAAQREERVTAGLEELQQWLFDLVRRGLVTVQGSPPSFWEAMAARLVDAQAPGAARRVRALARVPGSGNDWPERLLEGLARLHLLVESHRRIDRLPPPVREDVRAAIGWSLRQEEILAGDGVRDCWAVLGQVTELEDRLRVQRTWLCGEATGRSALLLSFAATGQPLEPGPVPGTRVDLELVFYPGAQPLRALVREHHSAPEPLRRLPGLPSLEAAAAAWAAGLAANPWLERIALPLSGVIPVQAGDRWLLRDAAGRSLPLAASAAGTGWTLLALGGGEPLEVACEWDGAALLPLGALAEGRFVSLSLPDDPRGAAAAGAAG